MSWVDRGRVQAISRQRGRSMSEGSHSIIRYDGDSRLGIILSRDGIDEE